MIDFNFREDQKSILELAGDFAAREIKPLALEYDRDRAHPEEILKRAHELGFIFTDVLNE